MDVVGCWWTLSYTRTLFPDARPLSFCGFQKVLPKRDTDTERWGLQGLLLIRTQCHQQFQVISKQHANWISGPDYMRPRFSLVTWFSGIPHKPQLQTSQHNLPSLRLNWTDQTLHTWRCIHKWETPNKEILVICRYIRNTTQEYLLSWLSKHFNNVTDPWADVQLEMQKKIRKKTFLWEKMIYY